MEKYREKQKLLSDVTLHETLSNGIDKNKKEDKEEEKEEDIIKGNSPKYLSILKKIKGYPFDYAKDAEYYHTLEERYPTVDLIQMLQDYAAYKLDHPLSKKDNPRSQINTQCKLCIQWNKCLKPIEKKVQKPEDIPEWFKKANGYK